MQADNEQISASQLTFLLVNAITGIGVLVIPARAAKAAGSAGWLAVLVTGLICTLLVWLIVRLCRKYPDQTIVEISIGLLGETVGALLGFHSFPLVACNNWFYPADFRRDKPGLSPAQNAH